MITARALLFPHHKIVQKESRVSQRACIQIVPTDARSLSELVQIIYHLKNFLSLGITRPVYKLSMKGTTEASKELIGDKPFYRPIEIHYE